MPPSSLGTWEATSALWSPFPHLHSDHRNSQDTIVDVSDLSSLRVQHVDAAEERLLAQRPAGGVGVCDGLGP